MLKVAQVHVNMFAPYCMKAAAAPWQFECSCTAQHSMQACGAKHCTAHTVVLVCGAVAPSLHVHVALLGLM